MSTVLGNPCFVLRDRVDTTVIEFWTELASEPKTVDSSGNAQSPRESTAECIAELLTEEPKR